MKSLSVVLLSIVLLSACAAPTAQESAELAAKADAWRDAFNAKNLDDLMKLYADDARFMPPNQGTLTTHDEIRSAMKYLMDQGLDLELATTEAMSAGDIGYRIGTFTLSTAEGAVADQGKYIELWRQVGGEWKITADVYNSDLPAGPTGAYMVGTHEVGDGAVWLSAWLDSDARREQFAANGVAGVRVFQDPENANEVAILLDVTDAAAFQAFLDSEEGAAAAAQDTVNMETLRVFMEKTGE